MITKCARIALVLATGVTLATGLALALAWQCMPLALPRSASAAEEPVLTVAESTTRYVAPDGDDANDCATVADRCRTIQRAVDAAETGDLVLVATGTYTGVRNVPSLNTNSFSATQVVVITKSLTVHGGYTTADWVTYDPEGNPTTVDAEGEGRVLVISGSDITPTVEGFRIKGGDATGLKGTPSLYDAGGGVYVKSASPTIRDCIVISNTASTETRGYGGGLYLLGDAIVTACSIRHNIASAAAKGYGGGLCIHNWDAMLIGSVVQDNTASLAHTGYGGGVWLEDAAPTLRANVVQSNTASTGDSGRGGGVFANMVAGATLEGNTVRANIASTDDSGYGGGVQLMNSSRVTVRGNKIEDNRGSTAWTGFGGGLRAESTSNLKLIGNVVRGNVASTVATGQGGGVSMSSCEDGTLIGNTIVSNAATLEPTELGNGGGAHLLTGGPFTLTNNLVAHNHANDEGGGLYFGGWSGGRQFASLYHTTVSDNESDEGSDGVLVDPYATLAFTNTIISGHGTDGLTVRGHSTATLEATLWYGNGRNIYDMGDIVTGTVNVYGDPAFVDPEGFDYHIGPDSAAIDAGIDAGVTEDIDGDPRPVGAAPDIGADEFRLRHVYLPLITRN